MTTRAPKPRRSMRARITELEAKRAALIFTCGEVLTAMGHRDIPTGRFWADEDGNAVRYFADELLAEAINDAKD